MRVAQIQKICNDAGLDYISANILPEVTHRFCRILYVENIFIAAKNNCAVDVDFKNCTCCFAGHIRVYAYEVYKKHLVAPIFEDYF